MFCLLVVLVKLSLLAKWLVRKTPLRKPNRGEGIVSRKPSPKSVQDFLGVLYCFIVLLCICVVSCPYVIKNGDILSYCYGAICPICAESAVKPQANKQTLLCIIMDIPVLCCGLHHNWATYCWRGYTMSSAIGKTCSPWWIFSSQLLDLCQAK